MKSILWILMLSIAVNVAADQMVSMEERPKYTLEYFKIPLGDETAYTFNSRELLKKKLWEDFAYEDYRITLRDGNNRTISNILMQKESKPNIGVRFFTANSEAEARLEMARMASSISASLEWMLKGYEVSKCAGEVALVSRPGRNNKRIYFIRSGVIVDFSFTGEQSDMEKLAKLIDDKIISAHKVILEQNKK